MSRLEDRREARDGLKALAGRQPVVAALDLGASKVTCFIMKPGGVNREDHTLQTAGVGHVQSRGVRGGSIVNMDEATDAIAQAVERAETVAGVSVQGVAVTTSGGQRAGLDEGFRLGVDTDDALASDVLGKVNNVRAQVTERPGTRRSDVQSPAERGVGVGQPILKVAGPHLAQRTDLSALDELSGELYRGEPAVVEAHHAAHTSGGCFVGRRHHRECLGDGVR